MDSIFLGNPSTPVSSVTGQQFNMINVKNEPPKGAPSDWTVDEVIQYISKMDSTLSVYADAFRTHVCISAIMKNKQNCFFNVIQYAFNF